MTPPQPRAPHYSALQLAWLQELGIEKPWLPSADTPRPALGMPPGFRKTRKAVATSVSPPARPHTDTQADSQVDAQADTQVLATAAADMQALADKISACQACGLCRERQQAVTGEGVMQPAIMVIGEAPGDLEDRAGRPFVDRSGQMLDHMLASINCSRTQNVYVSHVVKCRPPGNRNPKPTELASCQPFLLRQIELVRPHSILAVGRAAQFLLGTQEPLEKLRQKTHALVVAGQKIPVIATSHPVSLLNHPSEKAAAWQDLQRIRTVSGL